MKVPLKGPASNPSGASIRVGCTSGHSPTLFPCPSAPPQKALVRPGQEGQF